jgi:predicted nucleic acid-binding protein
MILLDTDVLSALMRDRRDPVVVRWVDRQPQTSMWISAITVLEVQFGLAIMSEGRRRQAYGEAFTRVLNEELERRVAPFDTAAAEETAALMASRKGRGVPRDLRDSMIAGIALSRRAALATRNVKHFDDPQLTVIDPWAA